MHLCKQVVLGKPLLDGKSTQNDYRDHLNHQRQMLRYRQLLQG